MEKLDLKKELKFLYTPSSKKVELLEVPMFKFLMIDGKIEPGEGSWNLPFVSREHESFVWRSFYP